MLGGRCAHRDGERSQEAELFEEFEPFTRTEVIEEAERAASVEEAPPFESVPSRVDAPPVQRPPRGEHAARRQEPDPGEQPAHRQEAEPADQTHPDEEADPPDEAEHREGAYAHRHAQVCECRERADGCSVGDDLRHGRDRRSGDCLHNRGDCTRILAERSAPRQPFTATPKKSTALTTTGAVAVDGYLVATATSRDLSASAADPRRSWVVRHRKALARSVPVLAGALLLTGIVGVIAVNSGTSDPPARAVSSVSAPVRAAQGWIIDNVSLDAGLFVPEEARAELEQWGMFANDLVRYDKRAGAAAIDAAEPDGWRELDYILTVAGRTDAPSTPAAVRDAIDNSLVVASFGSGDEDIEIRRVVAQGRPRSPLSPALRRRVALPRVRSSRRIRPCGCRRPTAPFSSTDASTGGFSRCSVPSPLAVMSPSSPFR